MFEAKKDQAMALIKKKKKINHFDKNINKETLTLCPHIKR